MGDIILSGNGPSSGGGGGAVTIADGADVTLGTIADAKVQGDNPGTISAKLRGLNASIAAGLVVTATDLDIRDLVFAQDKVDVSGSLVSISGTVAVTGPLTDTQLRATPVPVSGTVTITPSGTQDVNLTKVNGSTISLGLATEANSIPVVITNLADSVPVSGGPIIISGTGKGTTTPLSVTATAAGSNHNAFDVTWVKTSGLFAGQEMGTSNLPLSVLGTNTPNSSLPQNGLQAYPAISNATAPSRTEGAIQALSVDLSNNLRVLPSVLASTTVPSNTDGSFAGLSQDLAGNLRVTLSSSTGSDLSSLSLLREVLYELRAIHFQLAEMSDIYIPTNDVVGESLLN